ncbi:uncharacterized protein Z518_07885 [Rhinocladiella mackenziei CBS 650.93]|uniref:Uncharacterized protein n=1 Tax=Rhinocladiella mackenziei CBS 650.93 TaxID=1442369 RepID=A0A0D2IF97_9EURO|nr:uncharacterized protein Z518_07885 [Rhinocladiella mackenziei CBS 650.93]KIX01946.1 hypothetical protein Z518_07885 [Rhinocladiella mackenziei CBS 650.93]
MERPSKRMKTAKPGIRNPRDTGSRMTEGLFTSELGIRGDPDNDIQPTRTISLSDFQRRNIFGEYQRVRRPVLPRRNAGIYLLPRDPDATITASVIEINVNDGTSTSKVTEVPAATSGTVVSLSDMGSLTVPGITDTTSGADGSTTSSSPEIMTPPPTPSPSVDSTITPTADPSPAGSILSEAFNSTATLPDMTLTEGHTVTVTATSTFEISLINGTVVAIGTSSKDATARTASTRSAATTRSHHSDTFTFGQATATSSLLTEGSAASGYTGASASGVIPGIAVTGAAGSPTASSGSAATSDSDSGSGGGDGGGSGPGLTPTQQQVVGGVVGGVAGVALMLAIILVVLRWYRRRLKERGQLPEQIAARELASGSGPGASQAMSQRSSTTPLAAAVASSLKRLRPQSNQTLATNTTGLTDPSVKEAERGFQRIAGRKIAPVLSNGGDPYGGNYGAFEKESLAGPSDPSSNQERGLSGASFYRDSQGFYGGKGNQSPTLPPSPTTATTGTRTGDMTTTAGTTSSARDFVEPITPMARNSSQISLTMPSRPEGYAVMRPSPARTPVTLSPAASSIRLPIQQPPTMDENAPPLPTAGLPVPGLRDGVGRSLASQDGSRVSRSSGLSTGRFMENM